MDTITRYKCFIASPSDVSDEREEVKKAIADINREDGDRNKYHIKLDIWEDVVPAQGECAQSVINQQLKPGDQDFFVAVFWTKIGTPTKCDVSGTLEEIHLAQEAYRTTGKPRILLYFCTRDIPHDVDIDQLNKVREFKKNCQEGFLYKEFVSKEQLREKVRADIKGCIAEVREKLKERTDLVPEKDTKNQVLDILVRDSNDALQLFDGQNVKWVDRYICPADQYQNYSLTRSLEASVGANELIQIEESCVIKAPTQFGLTALAKQLILNAYRDNGKCWAYVDAISVKAKESKLINVVNTAEKLFGRTVDCILVDDFDVNSGFAKKLIENIKKNFVNTRIIIFQTGGDLQYVDFASATQIIEGAKVFMLLPLSKKDLRRIVQESAGNIKGNTDSILEKVIADMETLNVYRTPANCLTLLKAQEYTFDHRSINRTKLLELLLNSVFSETELPEYDLEPDVKDCEFVLGAFCEQLVRAGNLSFSEDYFRDECVSYIKSKKFDLQLSTLWNILYDNKIVIRDENGECRFRFSFWVYFFAAKRMAVEKSFKDYMLADRRYAEYPEIIEFYTGISRNETDLLRHIGKDLMDDLKWVNDKIRIEKFKNPLDCIVWERKINDFEQAKLQLKEEVFASNLPQEIKDNHSDLAYNHLRPHNQDVRRFLELISFQRFVFQAKTFARALRNSDYADADTRTASLELLMMSWRAVSVVLFALAPSLTQYQRASFLDFNVMLGGGFESVREKPQKLFEAIVRANPENVVRLLKDDLASERLGSLCNEYVSSHFDSLSEYLMAHFLIATRPKGWADTLRIVINRQKPESYFLFDVRMFMSYVYQYVNMSDKDAGNMRDILEHILARHYLNTTDRKHGHDFAMKADQQIPVRKADDF